MPHFFFLLSILQKSNYLPEAIWLSFLGNAKSSVERCFVIKGSCIRGTGSAGDTGRLGIGATRRPSSEELWALRYSFSFYLFIYQEVYPEEIIYM